MYVDCHICSHCIRLFLSHAEGEMRAGRSIAHPEFTFDVFMCVAILTVYSKEICKGADAGSVYGTLNKWAADYFVCVFVCEGGGVNVAIGVA